MSEDRLGTILRGITDGITVQDPSGRLLFANQAAARIMGFASSEELLAIPPEQILARFELSDEEGRPLAPADLPGRQALAGVESERLVGFRTGAVGEIRWSMVRGMPVFSDGGQVELAINVFRDVTERRALDEERERIRRRLAFLSDFTRALDEGPLDAESRLGQLAALAVPRLAEWCAVYLSAADRSILLKAFAHADPARVKWAREQHARFPMDPDQPFGVPRVIRTSDAVLQPELTDEMLVASSRHPEQLEAWRALKLRSSMVVPLRVRGRTLGAIAFADSERRFTDDELQLARELGERAGLAVETAQLYESARQAVRDREEMMAVVSHDLRNPLSTIAMAAELLLRSAAPESAERAGRAAANIQRAVGRMERMIHDLLDLARIEGGGLPLERIDHGVPQLVSEAIDLHSAMAAEKRLALINEAEEPITIRCDRERILQLLSNLLGNALKFTPEGGQIRVGARLDGSSAMVWVHDSGPGVPVDERARIFERYWQARRDRKGLGLGLAIARGVVEAHGGRIWVEGDAGARFVFTLPRSV